MLYNRLGQSGLQISRLSFGSWITFHSQVNESSATEMMNLAFENGVNFFDNAEVYADGKSEEIMGQALKKLAWPRLKYIVSTKFFMGLADGPNQRRTRLFIGAPLNGALKISLVPTKSLNKMVGTSLSWSSLNTIYLNVKK